MKRSLLISTSLALLSTIIILGCGPGVRTIGRRSTCPLNTTLSTVDDYQLLGTQPSIANRIRTDNGNTLYAVGRGLAAGAVARWIVRRGEGAGARWTTLDNFAYVETANTEANDFHTTDNGKLFVVGYGTTGGVEHWLVRRSTDYGDTWTTVDDFVFSAGQDSRAQAVTSDRLGNVFVAGFGSDGTSETWIVRKSEDGGDTWTKIDDFQFSDTEDTRPVGIAVDEENSVYVVGGGSVGSERHWLTRKIINGGNSWTTVDDFHDNLIHDASDIAYDGNGNLYVTGSGQVADQFNGFTRKSSNQGATWTTVDEFDYSSAVTDSTTVFWGIAVDPASNPYVVGSSDIGTETHWIVRSSNQGGSWSTIDDFLLAGGLDSIALGATFDIAGNLFVAGSGLDPSVRHWLVRAAACQ